MYSFDKVGGVLVGVGKEACHGTSWFGIPTPILCGVRERGTDVGEVKIFGTPWIVF